MKPFKLALLALTLLTVAALSASTHHGANSAGIALAMEPASWVFVAFGLAGGGFLHKRRPHGLDLTSGAQTPPAPQAPPAPSTVRRTLRTTIFPRRARRGIAALRRVSFASGAKFLATSTAALLLLFSTDNAAADTINLSSSPVSSIALSPSSDTLSLNSGSVTADSSAGAFTLQTGDFVIGDSEIPDQTIAFSFQDTLTLNGITEILTFNGQDVVTQSADTLTIFGGAPVAFGDELLSVQDFSLAETNMGDFQINTEASVTSTPEPGSLLLLGTGIVGGALVLARKGSVKKA